MAQVSLLEEEAEQVVSAPVRAERASWVAAGVVAIPAFSQDQWALVRVLCSLPVVAVVVVASRPILLTHRASRMVQVVVTVDRPGSSTAPDLQVHSANQEGEHLVVGRHRTAVEHDLVRSVDVARQAPAPVAAMPVRAVREEEGGWCRPMGRRGCEFRRIPYRWWRRWRWVIVGG